MSIAVMLIDRSIAAPSRLLFDQALRLALTILAAVAVYVTTAWLLKMDELQLLAGRMKAEQ